MLEHGGRNRAGRFFNFNGTAGIWRREAIADGGGWQHDTLTEDLDLSYRAQLRGWKFVFLPDLMAPAEVPVEMNAFKSQQHRWAKGSIQTCCKLLPRILPRTLPLAVKVEAFFHLTANFNYLLMAVLSILMFPSMVIRYNMGWYEMLLIDVPLFFAATMSVANFYMVCQREITRDWVARLKYLPFLMSIGIGLSVNNTRAVIEALLGKKTEFARTPKYRIERDADEWVGKRYRQSVVVQPLIELGLGLYFTLTVFYALANRIYGTLPFLVLFQIGFLYTGLLSIVQQFAGEAWCSRRGRGRQVRDGRVGGCRSVVLAPLSPGAAALQRSGAVNRSDGPRSSATSPSSRTSTTASRRSRSFPRADRRAAAARDGGPGARQHGPGARARHHDQGPSGAPDLHGPGRETYVLNLIDTPGHVDFSYEVTRSLAACEGALLLVDASQGVEAQTLANAYLAVEHGLEIIPVINKIDLPARRSRRPAGRSRRSSASTAAARSWRAPRRARGADILEAIVHRLPPPAGIRTRPSRR